MCVWVCELPKHTHLRARVNHKVVVVARLITRRLRDFTYPPGDTFPRRPGTSSFHQVRHTFCSPTFGKQNGLYLSFDGRDIPRCSGSTHGGGQSLGGDYSLTSTSSSSPPRRTASVATSCMWTPTDSHTQTHKLPRCVRNRKYQNKTF